ncbi:MAG: hypothetical protein HDQ88_11795 [Clostridia bacterium]|nr:hypothetical protein [Clostridia bacterium]
MLYVIFAICILVVSFLICYWALLSIRFRLNRSKVLDRSEFEWFFGHGPLELHDVDVDIEDVNFLEEDFEREVKKFVETRQVR